MINRDLAIVGMVCRTPGADSLDEFWKMLCNGGEGLRALSSEEIHHCSLKNSEKIIHAGGFLTGVEDFDAEQFGYTARDALYMDPQHRLFLQACWEALEISGFAGGQYPSVGVFASAGFNTYLTEMVLKQPMDEQQHQSALIGNSSDCLATRVSYCLNLTGPSMTIQCGCSSSLVAVHQARLALLAKQCDVALVGGISIPTHHPQGYHYTEGGFVSSDGHCRPFSDDASGTVFSSGYGVVVLRRLTDAIDSGDTIYAVIKGSAINNDGSEKASFTAPSVNGQASVIAKALRVSGVTSDSIEYIEAHGTGTPIGDPIELAALKEIFSTGNHCTLGAVKANVGHLDVAAGIIGLIKTSLMIYHKILPPQINFNQWNKRIREIPFKVNTEKKAWNTEPGKHRRAGVSAFGFGGTNAHIIIEDFIDNAEEKPINQNTSTLVVLSAKSAERLVLWAQRLAEYILKKPEISLKQLAYTLKIGRKQWSCRYSVSVSSVNELVLRLKEINEQKVTLCDKTYRAPDLSLLTDEEINHHWLSGGLIDWSTQKNMSLKKCLLPAAPLIKQSYWLNEASANVVDKILDKRLEGYDQWLYQSFWHETLMPNSFDLKRFEPLLLIGNKINLSFQSFLSYCEIKGISYCWIEPNDYFSAQNSSHYQLNLTVKDDWTKLERELSALAKKPKTLIQWVEYGHSWRDACVIAVDLLGILNYSTMIQSMNTAIYVTSDMSELWSRNNSPSRQVLIAMTRGIRQELPHLTTKLVDVDGADSTDAQCLQVIRSMTHSAAQDVIVWRAQHCWQMDFITCQLPHSEESYFKKNGIYVITGGLGDVASVHVDFLSKDYNAKVILLNRSSIPPKNTWAALLNDDMTSRTLKKKLCRLLDWEKQGFSVVCLSADITCSQELRTVCQHITETIGTIDGFIHCAGVGSDMHYKVLSDLTFDHCLRLFEPKLSGINAIQSVMKEFAIVDCLIISSISSALAGIGLSAYAGAHNLLDAYVKKEHPHWRIMNWDAWNFHATEKTETQLGSLGDSLDKLAITPEEGVMVLREAFSRGNWQQIFVSSVDLSSRVRRWIYRQDVDSNVKRHHLLPRPQLRSEYVKPSTDLQKKMVELWGEVVGVEPIGINDNFFELGGDSLLALELIQRLHRKMGFTCTIIDLFEASTISKLLNKICPEKPLGNGKLALAQARAAMKKAVIDQQGAI